MCDDRVGCIHYIPGRAVIALQAYDLALRVVLLEVQDILDLRSAEGIDGLAVVAHDAQVVVRRGQFLENQVLRIVGVLILVHKNIIEA